VTTPQAVTGVRGTIFTVEAGAGAKSTVAVIDGEVGVRTLETTKSPVKVDANQMTEAAANKSPADPKPISEKYLSQWALYAVKFAAIRGAIGVGAFQLSGGATAAGGAAVAGVAAVAAAGDGGGSGAPQTVIETASETGAFSPAPIDTDIDGSPAIGGRTVQRVVVEMLCDPLTVHDRFQIIYMGSVIGDTGMVGEDLGDPGEDIPLNASADGASPVVTIRVITGPLGTDWHWDGSVTYFLE
jgi:hypothetical protein